MASGAVFRLAFVAIVFGIVYVQAKKIHLLCITGVPVPMNTFITAKKTSGNDYAFIAATDRFGTVEIPDGNSYKEVKIYAQCIDLLPSKDTCTPVFTEVGTTKPLQSAADGDDLALFNDQKSFRIEEVCFVPPTPPGSG